MSEEIKETAGGELTQGEFKIKKKPKKLVENKTEIPKINLSEKKPEPEVTKIEVKNEDSTEDTVSINEVIKEEKEVEDAKDIVEEVKETKEEPKEINKRIVELPSDLEKVVNFMQDTGGSLQDYVRLNTDYSQLDETTLLREYYKNTKPHLDAEEVDFIMEDNFHYDEEVDEDRDIRKKKLAKKEEIAKAKSFLEDTKNKYYEEIRLKPNVSEDQRKAMDFFNRYNDKQQHLDKQKQNFVDKTKSYFSEDFKGFEFNLGEKTFNYNVNNKDEVAKEQAELQTIVKKFLNEDGDVGDLQGYHKALYAAKNADSIATHFYEQGKADGIKNLVNKSKNVDTAARPKNNEDIFINGLKVRAVNGVDSSKLKIQKRNKN